jgi:two-component system, chemotaxis family, CheB/CheR fusion protein
MSASNLSNTKESPAAPRLVGIGASAGGLDAIIEFVDHIPPNSGLAYIVVQHLDPTQKALLPELLQRTTKMPVREAKQGMRIEPDHIYIIPPNTELTVANNTLKLTKPLEPRGLRLPINVLFSSLAGTQGEHAIAVILSGMGSDGTLGAQAIKATGGLTLVQEPTTAQFDSMPLSAIKAGCADIIVAPAGMPARIQSFVATTHIDNAVHLKHETAASDSPLQQIVKQLHHQTRHDFSLYKSSTLLRRIERRMAIHGISSAAKYAQFLTQNPQETDLLFKEVLIGVTSFFRDTAVWEYLATKAIPDLLLRRTQQPHLRAWSVGCSTGEEAYSLAMLFTEVTEHLPDKHEFKLQIFASDLSPDAVSLARRGLYPLSISSTVSAERLARFFTAHDTYYQINKDIREMVLFAQHDVVLDPPFTRLDMLICRNLLIYFDALLQRRLVPLFHYSLRPGGLLLLGSSETIGRFHSLFTPVESKLRLYLRQDTIAGALPVHSFPHRSTNSKEQHVSPTNTPGHTTNSLQAAADHVLLQVYAPPAVVLNDSGDIVYISGRTGKYLEPAAGKANWNFHAMAREGLRGPLYTAIINAKAQSEALHLHGLHVATPNGEQLVDVTVQHLKEPPALQGMTMVVFRDTETPATIRRKHRSKDKPDDAHATELQHYQDEIHALREEARASKEELQSSNEELQSTNEELQSANEELTTSKEEMQSMNEELQTINNELQAKLDDLALAQSDLQNTLNSIEIAILFLDQHLNVRRYTDRAANIINLRGSDMGRPLSDLTTSLQYPDLHSDAQETLRTLAFSEKQVTTDDGRWFSIRIMPYRRLDNVIDGVVITLVDITATKELESALRKRSDS